MAVLNSITFKFSILLIILFSFDARETIAGISLTETITILNNVNDPTPTTITVNCKSKDDDLGLHTLLPGETYMFSFKPKILYPIVHPTVFSCSFRWPGNPHSHNIDIYDQSRDKCFHCNWKININGGCLNDGRCYPWKSVQLIMDDAYNTSKRLQGKGLDEIGHAYPPTF